MRGQREIPVFKFEIDVDWRAKVILTLVNLIDVVNLFNK